MYKNVASQRVAIYAWDMTAQAPIAGDSANITADYALDNGADSPTNDVNPTEVDAVNLPGVYYFDLQQAETNGDLFMLKAVSATADVEIDPVFVYTDQLTPTVIAFLDAAITSRAPSATALSDAVWTNAKAAFLDAAITSRSTLIQADILSDATPFPGADIDATISSRSTLAQADILSDATPFPGADIDATISSRSTLAQADILSDATPFAGANIDVASSTLATDVQAVAILAAIAALNDLSDVEVWTYVTRTLTAYPGLLGLLTTAVCTRVLSSTKVTVEHINIYVEAGTTRTITGSMFGADGGPVNLTGAELVWKTSTGLEKTSAGGTITILAPATGGAYEFTLSAAETAAFTPQGGKAAPIHHQLKVKLVTGEIYAVFEGNIRVDDTLIPAW